MGISCYETGDDEFVAQTAFALTCFAAKKDQPMGVVDPGLAPWATWMPPATAGSRKPVPGEETHGHRLEFPSNYLISTSNS